MYTYIYLVLYTYNKPTPKRVTGKRSPKKVSIKIKVFGKKITNWNISNKTYIITLYDILCKRFRENKI